MAKAKVDKSIEIKAAPISLIDDALKIYSAVLQAESGHYIEIITKDSEGKITDRRTFRRTL